MNGRPTRDDARLRREFLAEAEVLLESAATSLDQLDESGDDPPPETVNALFRAIHSLKGVSAMVGVGGMSRLAHDLESLLDAMRMGRVPSDVPARGAIREGVNALVGLAAAIGSGDADPGPDPALAGRVRAASAPRSGPSPGPGGPVLPGDLPGLLTDYERHRLQEAIRKGRILLLVALDLPFETFDEGLRRGMAEAGAAGELVGTFPGDGGDPTRMRFRLLVAVQGTEPPEAVAERCGGTLEWTSGAAAAPVPASPPPPKRTELPPDLPGRLLATTIRLPLEKVERLVDLAAELAVARGGLGRLLARAADTLADRSLRYDLSRAFAQLDRVAAEIGRSSLALRLVPVEQVTARLLRTVQQLANALGKEVTFEVYGSDTELDKSLADALADPLLHLVRNALDHGIEPPAERVRRGKERTGRVTLTVATRGRDVSFEIRDDGRGIDRAELLARARKANLLPPGSPEPEDPLQLVFLPGLSTANEVSAVSGRGVGLDVVRAGIEALRGRVAIRSEPGRGTSFEVVVPMTLALLETLVVSAGGLLFALPSDSVVRTLEASSADLETVDGVTCLPDVDRPLPSARLHELFGLESRRSEPERQAYLVAEDDGRRGAFGVDAVLGTLELVVKPLPDAIPRAPEISGVAEVPGSGLALALDTGRLLSRLGPAGETARRSR